MTARSNVDESIILGKAMAKHRNKIVILLVIQFVLSQLAIFHDASSIEEFFIAYIWSSVGSLMLGLVLLYKGLSHGWSCVIKGAFYLLTYTSMALLALLALGGFIQGPSESSGLIWAAFIFMYIILIPVGAMAGHVYCKYQDYAKGT